MSKVQGHYLRQRAQQKNTNLRIFPVFAHRLYCVSWVVEKTALKLSKVCDTDNQDGLIYIHTQKKPCPWSPAKESTLPAEVVSLPVLSKLKEVP